MTCKFCHNNKHKSNQHKQKHNLSAWCILLHYWINCQNQYYEYIICCLYYIYIWKSLIYVLSTFYLCLSLKRLIGLNSFGNSKISGFYVWILFLLTAWTCVPWTLDYWIPRCLNKFRVCFYSKGLSLVWLDIF